MKNLNYSRELYSFAKKFLDRGSYIQNDKLPLLLDGYGKVCSLHHKSIKFTLPNGGRVRNFDRENFNFLDDVIALPFKCICLEYYVPPVTRKEDDPYFYIDRVPQYTQEGSDISRKRLIYATDTGDDIEITAAFANISDKLGETWVVLPVVKINKETKDIVFPKVLLTNISDYDDELSAFLFFIKALSCSNVKVNKNTPSIKGKANTKRKGFIPYDSYHVLTIDVNYSNQQTNPSTGHESHASPREHIRRGHVRILASGKKIWINDTVVNKGVPNAVSKTYVMI